MDNPIRVLHILHSMNRGGAENAIMNYYRHIDRNSVQFDFLVTENKHMDFEDEIISMGGQIFRVPLLTLQNPFPYICGVYKFLKTNSQYKIVHSHTSSKSVLPLAIARFCNIPVRCSHSHSSMLEKGLNGIIRKWLMPFLKITATDMLSCGKKAGKYLYGEKAFKEGNVKIFNNVIEATKFRFNLDIRNSIRAELKIPETTLLLGHTARFDNVKNHLFDLEILKELVNSNFDVKLLLLGDGIEKENIIKAAKELNVLDRIIFKGVVSNVFDYEQAMDIFLLPSFREGLPLSIIEAQVSGLPCFTTKDRVSNECSITDLVTYLPLEIGAREWGMEIIKATRNIRVDRWEEIAKAGYDANTSSKNLQTFYINRYKEVI